MLDTCIPEQRLSQTTQKSNHGCFMIGPLYFQEMTVFSEILRQLVYHDNEKHDLQTIDKEFNQRHEDRNITESLQFIIKENNLKSEQAGNICSHWIHFCGKLLM